ncbi:MAG: HDIG domain-containing metalloprotein [Planctomycetota bacterium]|nr:HDIG domain-containing metalloprotein [Planctomycetota bacterium]
MAKVRARSGGKTWQRLSFGRRQTRSSQIATDEASSRRAGHYLILLIQVLTATFLIGWKSFETPLLLDVSFWEWGELFANVVLIFAGALLLARAQRRDRERRDLQIGRTFLLLNGFLVANWVILQRPDVSVMLLPVPLLGMVLGFLLRINRAVLVSLVAIAITALMVQIRLPEINPVGLAVAQFLGILVAIQGVQRVRSRTRILTVGFLAGLTQAVAIVLLNPIAFKNLTLNNLISSAPLPDAMWSLVGGIAAGVLITSALPFLEKWFDVLTEIRLMELADTHRPLLNEFSLLAPGSFQHSLMVGQLAEEAAGSIGANGLLCRVGALYHDIGKMMKPGYFVENMQGGENVHDRLSPEMSRLVVIAHVKDGMRIAEEEHLPTPIVDMIPMHHGTSVVEFFFNKKAQQVDEEEADRTRDAFRYPGPRPTFREAGILMLADGVEASSRTLSDPTPTRVRQHVRNIVQARSQEGQLDECELTMSDLHRIEDAFVRVLTAIHHGRVKYPTDVENESNNAAANSDSSTTSSPESPSDSAPDSTVTTRRS